LCKLFQLFLAASDKLFTFAARYHYMDTNGPIINKVAQKAITTLDLADLLPRPEDMVSIDLADYLYKGLILREEDFRQQIKDADWTKYTGKYVTIYSSVDAIVPMWAYMVLSAQLSPYAHDIAHAHPDHSPDIFLYRAIERLDTAGYAGQRVVIKGCGDRQLDPAAFVHITHRLAPVARAIMYGEPCSMVPVYKKVIS
jgi:hypothetical protein